MTTSAQWIDGSKAAWQRFWFEPDTARNLAIARIIVGAHALWHFLSRDFAGMSAMTELWTSSNLQRWRYFIFVGHPGFESVLHWIAVVALLGVIFGVYPRVACVVAGVLTYHLAPFETAFWGVQPTARGLTLAPLMLVILACTRSADSLTLLKNKRPSGSDLRSWEYGWPRKLLWLLLAQIYVFAFYGKMVLGGPSWAAAENIRLWFLVWNLSDWWRFREIGLWIADQRRLCMVIGILTLAFQSTFIATVFSRRARYVLVPVQLMFGVSTAITLNIHVGEGWLTLLFVNWDWVLGHLGLWQRAPAGHMPVLAAETA